MKIINSNIILNISEGNLIKLNLGAGKDKVQEYYNVDLIELPGTDIVADLNNTLDQIPNSSVEAIYSRGCFEHIKKFTSLITELHRICVPGALIKTIVPHFSNPYYYSDPTHVQQFGLYTMHYFMDEKVQIRRKVPSYYTSARFELKSIKILFYRETLFDKLFDTIFGKIININIHTQDIYERRFCYFFPASQIVYEIKVIK